MHPNSLAAKRSLDTATVREMIYNHIDQSGVGGLTADEAEVATGWTHQTVSPRFTELKAAEKIIAVAKRPTRSGRLADVYVSPRHAKA